MDWWIVVIVVTQIAFVAFIIAIAVSYRQKTLQRRSEERLRILDRFGSGQELGEFLATERGRQFLGLFAVKADNPSRVVISGIAVATILIFLGSAFLLLSALDAQDLRTEYMVAAVMVLAIAFGIFAASMLSIRLARKLNLLPPEAADAADPAVDLA
ncbi:MAG: hypothetical protein GY719_41170 [bacterium]|nr:hypothetical protein [bacterium]